MWQKPFNASSNPYKLIRAEDYNHYIEGFNRFYPESLANAIPDSEASEWILSNVPLLDCPDILIEEIYYFRWWTYRKHIKHTSDGFVVTEFLPVVKYAGKHNTINCPVGHQIYEGRWIRNQQYLDDYCAFMLRGGGNLHQYSCWFADAVYKRFCVNGDRSFAIGLLEDLQGYFQKWSEREQEGLFHHSPWMDGMEFSICGNMEERFRPTMNSYMYADAMAISGIAKLADCPALAADFASRAQDIKSNVQRQLWHPDLQFFCSLDLDNHFTPVGDPVREAVGYVPWCFELPDPGYESAWIHLNDTEGFRTDVGLTVAETRHPMYLQVNPDNLASWDGAIWPFATSQTLMAMQNLIRGYGQDCITAADYVRELSKYAASHRRDGKPSICEVVRDPRKPQMCGSEHYNHSTFCDLVITGLGGIQARPDNVLELFPLFPKDWDYFCLDGIRYHNHLVTIAWDRTGEKYGDKGFVVYVDGENCFAGEYPCPVTIDLTTL